MINFFLSLFDILNIFLKMMWFGVINIPAENSSSRTIRCVRFLNPFYLLTRGSPAGQRITSFLESLGPMFIKFGQLLSTRSDVVPAEIIGFLNTLTDQCKPFPAKDAKNIIERSLGINLQDVYKNFEEAPMAAASLAQVHRAQLISSSEHVVIKVLRPGIHKKVQRNIGVMKVMGFLVNLFYRESHRLKLNEVIGDYERTIKQELDLKVEAANTSATRKNFANSELLYIPKIFWDHTSVNVLTLEEIDGLACTDTASMDRLGINRKKLAENGVRIFLDQVFRDNFFHADMHPGNIFVSKENVQTPSYIAIDCAIVGSLTQEDQYNLARMLQATLKQVYPPSTYKKFC